MTSVEVAFRIAMALLLGLVFGSFLTVAIHRIPAGESILRPRSRCPACGTPLRNVDNIPVISWLALRGRCHSCQARISPVYPLTELATGALFVGVALWFEDPWQAVLLAPFLGLLVAISVIDARTKKIPNRLVYPALLVSAVVIVAGDLAGGGLDAASAASFTSPIPMPFGAIRATIRSPSPYTRNPIAALTASRSPPARSPTTITTAAASRAG